MMTFSITLGMEYVALFLLDFTVARPLWDPLFMNAKEIEKKDQNNRVLHLVYKPVDLLNFPWFFQCSGLNPSKFRSRMRDYCVHLHYNYDSELNTYYIMLSSIKHPSCGMQPWMVRGEMRTESLFTVRNRAGLSN